jgi:hypothetical protein
VAKVNLRREAQQRAARAAARPFQRAKPVRQASDAGGRAIGWLGSVEGEDKAGTRVVQEWLKLVPVALEPPLPKFQLGRANDEVSGHRAAFVERRDPAAPAPRRGSGPGPAFSPSGASGTHPSPDSTPEGLDPPHPDVRRQLPRYGGQTSASHSPRRMFFGRSAAGSQSTSCSSRYARLPRSTASESAPL